MQNTCAAAPTRGHQGRRWKGVGRSTPGAPMRSRREFLKTAGGVVLATGAWAAGRAHGADPVLGPAELPEGTLATSILEALPGKVPLIKKSWRPPNYETPVSYFNEVFTPNDAFFVRYHLTDIPDVAADSWRLKVGGESVATPLELSLDNLRTDFEQVEIAAVCQCSGNRRGMFVPHVPGVEWGPGAMGNARWRGVRLKDVLAKAGLKKDALEIVLDGADAGVFAATPDFVKSIPVWKAVDDNTLIAYSMNGAPLPYWNGFPARIVVPGWTATYWMKQVTTVNAVAKPFDGFWVKSAYRIPRGKFPLVDRFVSQETDVSTPITEMVVNSLITNVVNGQQVPQGRPFEIKGVAWDGGYGIARVEVSTDGGEWWHAAALGQDYGRFSFRPWTFVADPRQRGPMVVLAKATNRAGATQTFELIANPAGYHHNVVQRVTLDVA
jgi:DMSO/TMAO reductase YedYZ molybdopterin-dependent catalytic subunit